MGIFLFAFFVQCLRKDQNSRQRRLHIRTYVSNNAALSTSEYTTVKLVCNASSIGDV